MPRQGIQPWKLPPKPLAQPMRSKSLVARHRAAESVITAYSERRDDSRKRSKYQYISFTAMHGSCAGLHEYTTCASLYFAGRNMCRWNRARCEDGHGCENIIKRLRKEDALFDAEEQAEEERKSAIDRLRRRYDQHDPTLQHLLTKLETLHRCVQETFNHFTESLARVIDHCERCK